MHRLPLFRHFTPCWARIAAPVRSAIFLLVANTAWAASVDNLAGLNALIENDQFTQAYTLARQMRDANEGDPDFDFLYGLAALETQHPNEAVFALERVAAAYPDRQRVKLELARAFYQSNNLAASRGLFEEVLATDPDPEVRDDIEAFLGAIHERERAVAGSFSWFVNSNVGSDSNINSATELGVISTPVGDIELSDNGKRIDDNFLDLGGGMSFSKPLSKNSAFNLAAGFNRHDNIDTDDFDLNVLSTNASYSRVFDRYRLTYGLRGQFIGLREERFQDSASFITTLQHAAENGWSRALTGAYTSIRYDNALDANANLRDVDQYLVSGMVGKVMGRFSHSVSLYYGDEEARRSQGKNHAQRFYGVAFAEQYRWKPNHAPYFRISLHQSDNKADAPIFSLADGIKRQDKTLSTSFGWSWRANRFANFTTDITYTDNESNIDLFSYDRLKFQTGLRYQF
jgi:tetratricopeptide (TPR) repeat protein